MICMKKFALFLICLALCFSFSACKEQKTADDKTPVVINMPTDDTVNGYRVSAKGSLGNTISAESVTVGDTDSSSEVSSGYKVGYKIHRKILRQRKNGRFSQNELQLGK